MVSVGSGGGDGGGGGLCAANGLARHRFLTPVRTSSSYCRSSANIRS